MPSCLLFFRFAFCGVFVFLVCCSGDSVSDKFPHSNPEAYFKTSQTIEVEVHYEEGHEPFAGLRFNGDPLWSVLETNLQALFQYRSTVPNLIVPKELESMSKMPILNQSSWSTDQILELHNQQFKKTASKETAVFYIYFLGGFSESGESVIGLSINGTPVIALFKDVIRSLGGNATQKFVEQSTLVHEMGHAVGLVNNGVPVTSSYHDNENGTHSSNDDSVMYWLNEGKSDMVSFVQKYISSGSVEMWGPEELEDVRSYSK